MKIIFKIALYLGLINIPTLFGQNANISDGMIEVLTDTIVLKKQTQFNNIGSRSIINFELPTNTTKWGYYFESIEKENINKALLKKYFTTSDFIEDTITDKKITNNKFNIRVVKMGPTRIETLLLDNKGKTTFLNNNNGICLITRPDGYFKDESILCEPARCYSSNKIISNTVIKGEYYLGFRNIDYRKEAFIVIQIIAFVN